jgi:hypothetical protein
MFRRLFTSSHVTGLPCEPEGCRWFAGFGNVRRSQGSSTQDDEQHDRPGAQKYLAIVPVVHPHTAVIRPPPIRCVMPTARAAPTDRSRIFPVHAAGPRSLMVTTTLRPPWVTVQRVRQGPMSRHHGVLIEALVGCGFRSGLLAIEGRHPGEATAGSGKRWHASGRPLRQLVPEQTWH